MNNRLSQITNWKERARRAGYDATVLARSCLADDRTMELFFSIAVGMHPQEWLDGLREMDMYVARQEPKSLNMTA